MVSPILSSFKALTQPLQSFISRATTMPGGPGLPDIPPPPIPGSAPTQKPNKKGMQQSFLSGVAASGLSSGSSGGGKTLLGS